jgi:hypothetical protein
MRVSTPDLPTNPPLATSATGGARRLLDAGDPFLPTRSGALVDSGDIVLAASGCGLSALTSRLRGLASPIGCIMSPL